MNPSTFQAAPPPAPELDLAAQTRLLRAVQAALQAQLSQVQPGAQVQRFETHISVVLVALGRAWKFKKPLNLGFLDFSTLAQRHHYCDEELRLNRRLAPQLYRAVRAVTGSLAEPHLAGLASPAVPAAEGAAAPGAGQALEWAVEMLAFDQAGLWSQQLRAGALGPAQVDALADQMARFHATAAVAPAAGALGSPAQVRAPLQDSLADLLRLLPAPTEQAALQALAVWEARTWAHLQPVLAQRQQQGRVRECHGDLHLGNVAEIDGHTTVFDGIEFNEAFRWIDVMSEIAFLAMDLLHQGRADLAWRFVNRYLEQSGDYAGLPVLRYYLVHRALVRAKVTALQAGQPGADEATREARLATARRYLALAGDCLRPGPALLLITHGVSGSGKSTLTQGLIEVGGLIRVRADVERKRLFGLAPLDRAAQRPDLAIYTAEATAATHARLLEAAGAAVAGGFAVALDATFMRRAPRDQARAWAVAQGVRLVVLDFQVDPATLRQRVQQRLARADDASDADLAVLASQWASATPLEADEHDAVAVNALGGGPDVRAEGRAEGAAVAAEAAALWQRLHATP